MTRVSLTEDYDDRSVIAKLKKMDEKLDADAGIVSRAEESARASAEAAQATADRFAGSVGVVVSDAKGEIAKAGAEVTKAKAEVDETVSTVAQAVTTANSASASAQQSAQTVQGYEDRLQRAEVGIQTLDGETADLYARDAMNLKSNEPNQTAQGLRIGTHDLSKAVTTDEAQTITGKKTITSPDDVLLTFRSRKGASGSGVMHDVVFTDADGNAYGSIQSFKGSAQTSNYIEVNRGGVKAEGGVAVSDTTGAFMFAPTPSTGAPSTAVTTKAYVEATDGVTNNLVHRTADEVIGGKKTFGVETRFTGDWVREVFTVTNFDTEHPVSLQDAFKIYIRDKNGVDIGGLRLNTYSNGTTMMQIMVRNANGTMKYQELLRGDSA